MRLREKLNRRVGDKQYLRWYVNLTKEDIAELGWPKGQELESIVRNGTLIIKPRSDHQ